MLNHIPVSKSLQLKKLQKFKHDWTFMKGSIISLYIIYVYSNISELDRTFCSKCNPYKDLSPKMLKKIHLLQIKTVASSSKSVITKCVRNQTILSQSTVFQTYFETNMCRDGLVIHITVMCYYSIQI